ncbi:MAG: YajQ family cyclic di-GMP-binding protein [Spirochaetia bacterium]|nr:YajQ family cyclic di-GMP-binding protein [Spirochaetia bacterium]
MMADVSFDIISEINHPELINAIDQTKREIQNRFDFKNSIADLETTKEEVTITADDESRLKQLLDIFETKLVKRGIALKALTYQKLERAAGSTVKQKAKIVAGLDIENSKKINKIIKDSNLKVKTQNMDQKIRVTGKSRDDLQDVIQLLKSNKDITIPLQFNNYR